MARFLNRQDLMQGHIKAAIAQLRVLFGHEKSKEGTSSALDTVTRVFAHVTAEELENAFAERYALKRSGGACCAMRLLGKRTCPSAYHPGVCRDHSPPSADHVTLWNKGGKPQLMVWHPYGLIESDLRSLFDYCDRLGFEFTMGALSFYYPGGTHEVCMWKKGSNPLE